MVVTQTIRPLKTMADLLRMVQELPENPRALNDHVKGSWIAMSTSAYIEAIKYLSLCFIKRGFKKGDMCGILAPPSARWTIADIAIMIAGGVTVPLFANISEDNFVFEVTQSEVKWLLVSGIDQWALVARHRSLFNHVLSLDEGFDQLIEEGKAFEKEHPTLWDNLCAACSPDELATIIYTSGTTGVPKGAELTQSNLCSLLHLDYFHWNGLTDRYLSILPLSHIFARMLNFILLSWGVSIYYFNDIKNIAGICREIHPTVLVVVPRLLEKVYAKMLLTIEHAGLLKKLVGKWAFALALNDHDTLSKHLMQPLADKIVYSSLRDALGGSLRVVISGGAPLSPHLGHFFNEIGVPIYEGWGLTEGTPITVNRPGHNKIGTVGLPLDQMEIKILEDGEILARGPLIMRGYHYDPANTAKALDHEGWLHTGDKGSIDEEGFLTIIGRLKELYKTSTGEWIAPIPIEQALGRMPLIDMAVVVGDTKKFTSCLLFPNFDVVVSLKNSHGMTHLSNQEFLNTAFVKSEMSKILAEINKHVNQWERIHVYRFIDQPPTIEGGELTPSMKIRRDVVFKKYKHLIDEMYA